MEDGVHGVTFQTAVCLVEEVFSIPNANVTTQLLKMEANIALEIGKSIDLVIPVTVALKRLT